MILKAFGVENSKPKTKRQDEKIIKNILPYQDYLISNPVLYDEEKLKLDHSGYKIDMKEFLKHNWQDVMFLNFSNSLLHKNR